MIMVVMVLMVLMVLASDVMLMAAPVPVLVPVLVSMHVPVSMVVFHVFFIFVLFVMMVMTPKALGTVMAMILF